MRQIDADALRHVLEAKLSALKGQRSTSVQGVREVLKTALDALKEQETAKPRWISVDEALPTEIGQDCWVWADGWEHDDIEPTIDWWEGRRGEKVYDHGTGEEFISSGFYHNDMERITHWMPCDMPEPPKSEV